METPIKITLVTPSYNQSKYLKRTIDSVLAQNYANLEYIIIDGGSTDDSISIIRQYEDKLAYWVSEQDFGQSSAINKGLKRATGDVVGWLNSDDTLHTNALNTIASHYAANPKTMLLYGHSCLIDVDDRVLRRLVTVPTSYNEIRLLNRNVFCQPGTTWRRQLHQEIGFLDESLHYYMDNDFWLRASQLYKPTFIPHRLGNLRHHRSTKSETFPSETKAIELQQLAVHGTQTTQPIRRIRYELSRFARICASPRTVFFKLGLVD